MSMWSENIFADSHSEISYLQAFLSNCSKDTQTANILTSLSTSDKYSVPTTASPTDNRSDTTLFDTSNSWTRASVSKTLPDSDRANYSSNANGVTDNYNRITSEYTTPHQANNPPPVSLTKDRRYAGEKSKLEEKNEDPENVMADLLNYTSNVCPFKGCHKVFARPYNVKLHFEAAHRNYRPFQCEEPYCDAKFARKYDFKRHLRSHQGIKSFECPECKCSFSRKEHLQSHLMNPKAGRKCAGARKKRPNALMRKSNLGGAAC
ncbi:hypothetical protein BC833DRAFT_578387 [Globomyces pollinis-pini]|nr:hypothetical protein BC833DRAFT_578387 [Globomyces pollinis-pini]